MVASTDRSFKSLPAGATEQNDAAGADVADNSVGTVRGNAHRRNQATNQGTYFGARHVDSGLSGYVNILGQPGCGKTYLATKLIARCRRVIHYDTVANVGSGERQNQLPGFTEICGLASLREFLCRFGGGRFRVLYRPGLDRGVTARNEFDAVCKLVCLARNVVFSVDEVWRFCQPNFAPEPLCNIAFTGRHYGVTLVTTAQRPARVAKDLLAIASQHRIFRMPPSDIAGIQRHISMPDELAARVLTLPDRVHYLRDERFNWLLKRGA